MGRGCDWRETISGGNEEITASANIGKGCTGERFYLLKFGRNSSPKVN